MRSNVSHWQQLQDDDYFETHPCYKGLVDMPDEALPAIERVMHLGPSSKVVVIGCGYGRETAHIAPRVGHVYGIDVSDRILDKARRYISEKNITNFTGVPAGQYVDIIPREIDLVYSIVVMQHLTRDLVREYFLQLGRKLTSDGRFVVQFLEVMIDGMDKLDAELKVYEPSVTWTIPQIVELARYADLKFVDVHTIQATDMALWHWSHFRR